MVNTTGCKNIYTGQAKHVSRAVCIMIYCRVITLSQHREFRKSLMELWLAELWYDASHEPTRPFLLGMT